MMHSAGVLVVLSILAATASASVSEHDISAAYFASDAGKLEELHDGLGDDGYLSAYLDWRLGSLLFGRGDSDAADAVWQRGQTTLERLVAQQPDSAEALALYSSTLGMRIGVRPGARGMKMGSASGKAAKRARKLEPANPRVLLISGVNKYNTPAIFGGGLKKAIRYLNEAVSVWESDDNGIYQWGKPDTYVWRGQAYRRAGDTAAACADFRQALAAAPGFRWAMELLAQIEADCPE